MLDIVADGVAEAVKQHLSRDKDEHAKEDMPHRPAVIKSAVDKHQLHDNVDSHANGVQKVQDNKQPNRTGRIQPAPTLEGEERDDERNGKHADRTTSQQPDRKRRSIFVQLKSDKAVDEETCAECRCEAVLYCSEVRKRSASRGNNAGIDNERAHGQKHVNVEECDDFLAAYL